MFQAELRVATGKQTGSVIPLPVGKFLVGREEDCHLRPNSDLVSRHHCVFTLDEYSIRLRDLGSTNGTFVNGERIRGQVVLKEGDRVVIGKLEFDMVIRDPSMEETTTNLAQATQTEVIKPATPEPIPAEKAASETLVEMPTTNYVATVAGDTAFPGMPPGMGQPGMYGQPPMGYPPQYPPMQFGYPGYQMPGYYQQPMAYPQMGMYPGMAPPMMPPQGMPATATVTEPAAAVDAGPEIRLPDPETTGAKPPEPKPIAPAGDGAAPVSMRDTAADIINKYRTRPPAG
ncbi:MAG TPA: FHA domain-containing protein [Caulifigura sp.]|jgi:pSer/pThr/pTyr-binding forkhead associated (FHA) protein|nr:FHA domain-containing protein [Caulifigura sp.]